jgi:hypothetical protein
MAPEDSGRIGPLRTASELALRRWRGDEGIELLRREAEAAERAGDPRAAALALTKAVEVGTRMAGITGDVPKEEMHGMLERAREIAPAGDRVIDGWLCPRRGLARVAQRQDAEIEKPARRALEIGRETGNAAALQRPRRDHLGRLVCGPSPRRRRATRERMTDPRQGSDHADLRRRAKRCPRT